jgi:hypothetical protein
MGDTKNECNFFRKEHLEDRGTDNVDVDIKETGWIELNSFRSRTETSGGYL